MTEAEFISAKEAYSVHAFAALFTAAHRRPPRMIGLCSGTHSVEKAFKEMYPNAKIITVDIDASTRPTHAVDVRRWDFTAYPPGYFDFGWASPPCTQYSNAKTTGERDIAGADSIVKACLKAFDYLLPTFWVMENPVGLLRHRPFMQHIAADRHTTSYCHFGFPYRKLTDLWTNIPTQALHFPQCPKEPCEEHRKYGHHTHTAQRGSTTTALGCQRREVAYRVPTELVKYILRTAFSGEHLGKW